MERPSRAARRSIPRTTRTTPPAPIRPTADDRRPGADRRLDLSALSGRRASPAGGSGSLAAALVSRLDRHRLRPPGRRGGDRGRGRADQIAAANARAGRRGRRARARARADRAPEYIAQQARGYRLGGPREIPFTPRSVGAGAAADAPGFGVVRLGATRSAQTPLEVLAVAAVRPDGLTVRPAGRS